MDMKSSKEEVNAENEGPNGQSNPTPENGSKPVGYGSSMQTDAHANGMDRRQKNNPIDSSQKKPTT